MTTAVDIIKFFVSYILTIFYSLWIGALLGITYIFKRNALNVKERPNQPLQLRSEEHGVHKFAEVNGIKIHYVEKGDPKNPLIVFVHGFPEFWYSWRYQLKEFSKDYWTVAIDMRGYGESDKPQSQSAYFITNMSDDINALVKKLGREKFILVAHDWGAAIGFNYIDRYMSTVDKYVLIGGPPSEVWKKLITSSLKQFFMSWYIFFFQTPYLPEMSIRAGDLKAFNFMELGSKEDIECFKYTFSQPNALTYPLNYYRAISILNPYGLKPPKNCAPGLFLLGEYDKYIAPVTGKLAMKRYERLEFKTIKGANHFAQQHKPDETNRMIREFLEKK